MLFTELFPEDVRARIFHGRMQRVERVESAGLLHDLAGADLNLLWKKRPLIKPAALPIALVEV